MVKETVFLSAWYVVRLDFGGSQVPAILWVTMLPSMANTLCLNQYNANRLLTVGIQVTLFQGSRRPFQPALLRATEVTDWGEGANRGGGGGAQTSL